MPDPLEERRLLVVGASSGIGASLVRRAAGRGARVAAAARRVDALAEVVGSADGGVGSGAVVPMDVRDEGSVARGVAAAADALGGLDAVVYTAAVSPLVGVPAATAGDWHEVLATNVVGCALVIAAAAPHLRASDGRVVVLSSKAVRRPFPGLGVYATSKVALDGLLGAVRVELPWLRVTRVVVGNTHGTDFSTSWDPEAFGAALSRWADEGVLGSAHTMAPDEVADVLLDVLASPVHVDDLAVVEDPVPPGPTPGPDGGPAPADGTGTGSGAPAGGR